MWTNIPQRRFDNRADAGSRLVEERGSGVCQGQARSGMRRLAIAAAASVAACLVAQGCSSDEGGEDTSPVSAGGAGGMQADSGVPQELCDDVPPPSQDCAAPLSPGDDRSCTIGDREYFMYAPPNYNPCEPTALVVDLHGAMETAAEQAGLDTEFCALGACWPGRGSGWRLEADTPDGGFIVATPQGIGNVWTTTNNDPQFILDIVAHIKTVADIHPDRVYLTGISNGAGMTCQAGCPNTDVFSGFAPHAGGAACSSLANPTPTITIDATGDFAWASAESATQAFVQLNNCTGGPTEWLVIDSSYDEPVCRDDPYSTEPTIVPCSSITPPVQPTVCTMWDQCDGGVEVVFCEVAPSTLHEGQEGINDAHIVYGNATYLNTPSLVWRFFKRFW